MTFPKTRLVVAAVLFVGWLGFLGYLTLHTSDVVLSRPQFMLAQAYVVADVAQRTETPGKLDTSVAITEVLWVADTSDRALAGRRIVLANLASWQGEPGLYLLPLQKTADGKYKIAPIPQTQGAIRIYPWTQGTRAQVQQLMRSKA